MDESAFQQPTAQQLSAFAQGDPIAKDEIAHLVLPSLARWAWSRYPNLPRDEVQSIVNGALAGILRHHERYDPAQSSFTTYAIHLIKLRLASLYQALQKIKAFQEAARENLVQPAYNSIDTVELDRRIERDQFFGTAMKRLEGAEKEFLRLILQGEKQQAAFAKVLARYGQTKPAAQEVKNVKARLLRKLQALADEMGYEAGDLLDT
jgi:DNA-directed RNA polymerase specialized sigma subunit